MTAEFPPSQPSRLDFRPELEITAYGVRVTAAFDLDGAAGKAQQSVRLEAPAAVKIHGDRPAKLW